MFEPIPLDGPIDLGALAAFLSSDRTPPDCMRLSELDGLLAGIAAGPVLIPPSIWLPMIWHGAPPIYADTDEMKAVLGAIVQRYNETLRALDDGPGSYAAMLVERADGGFDASDWTLGFLQAMAQSQDDWAPLIQDRSAGALIAPIMMIASTTDRANLPLDDDERLPDAEMAKLLAGAPQMLGLCVSGMRAFFRTRRERPVRRRAAQSKRARRMKSHA